MPTQLKRKQPILHMCNIMYERNRFQQAVKSSKFQICCVYIVNHQAYFITKPHFTVQSVQKTGSQFQSTVKKGLKIFPQLQGMSWHFQKRCFSSIFMNLVPSAPVCCTGQWYCRLYMPNVMTGSTPASGHKWSEGVLETGPFCFEGAWSPFQS